MSLNINSSLYRDDKSLLLKTHTVSFDNYNKVFSVKLSDIHPSSDEEFEMLEKILKSCLFFLSSEESWAKNELESCELDPHIPIWLKKYSCSLLDQCKSDLSFVNFNSFQGVRICQKNFITLTAKKINDLWNLTPHEKSILVKYGHEIDNLLNKFPYESYEQLDSTEQILGDYAVHLSNLKYNPTKTYVSDCITEERFKEAHLSMSYLLNNRTSGDQILFSNPDDLKTLHKLLETKISNEEKRISVLKMDSIFNR